MRYGNYDINVEDVSIKEDVYVIKYVELNENNCAMCSAYVGYVPLTKVFGLETYFTSREELFEYKYDTEIMGAGSLGIIKNDIKVDKDIVSHLSVAYNTFINYERFLKSFENIEEITKLFDKIIVDYQL